MNHIEIKLRFAVPINILERSQQNIKITTVLLAAAMALPLAVCSVQQQYGNNSEQQNTTWE